MSASGKALLCDFDGTLADSLGHLRIAYAAFLERFGIAPRSGEFDELNGPPLAEVVAILCRRHRLPVAQEDALRLYNDEIAAAWPSLRPSHGARLLLETARDAGWRVGIVTSNAARAVEAWLDRVGLSPLVGCVVGGDTRPGKPDPAPYLAGLRRLGAEAGLSLAIEDSPTGSRSARAAGLRTLYYAPYDRAAPPPGLERLTSLPAACPALTGRAEALSVRLACEPDLPFLYALRNDPTAIAVSRTPRHLTQDELEERFRLDPTLRAKITMIVEQAGRPAGMVRFDRVEDFYRISIVIEQAYRGQGLGLRGLTLAVDAFLAVTGAVAVEAEVAEGNIASASLFERAGFKRAGTQGGFLRFRLDDAFSGGAMDPGFRNEQVS